MFPESTSTPPQLIARGAAATQKDVETVADYIADAPAWARPVLRELRRVIRKAAPRASESISYHMPYYSQNGRLAYFAAFTNHCSFFWISAEDKKAYAKELASQKVVGSTLRIPKGGNVPSALIEKLVRGRVRQNEKKKRA